MTTSTLTLQKLIPHFFSISSRVRVSSKPDPTYKTLFASVHRARLFPHFFLVHSFASSFPLKKKCALGFQNGTLRFGNLTCVLKSQSASFPFWQWRRTPTTGYLFYLASSSLIFLVDPDLLFLNVSVNVILFYSTRLIFNFTLPKI